jgi:hypothetical protein
MYAQEWSNSRPLGYGTTGKVWKHVSLPNDAVLMYDSQEFNQLLKKLKILPSAMGQKNIKCLSLQISLHSHISEDFLDTWSGVFALPSPEPMNGLRMGSSHIIRVQSDKASFHRHLKWRTFYTGPWTTQLRWYKFFFFCPTQLTQQGCEVLMR